MSRQAFPKTTDVIFCVWVFYSRGRDSATESKVSKTRNAVLLSSSCSNVTTANNMSLMMSYFGLFSFQGKKGGKGDQGSIGLPVSTGHRLSLTFVQYIYCRSCFCATIFTVTHLCVAVFRARYSMFIYCTSPCNRAACETKYFLTVFTRGNRDVILSAVATVAIL